MHKIHFSKNLYNFIRSKKSTSHEGFSGVSEPSAGKYVKGLQKKSIETMPHFWAAPISLKKA